MRLIINKTFQEKMLGIAIFLMVITQTRLCKTISIFSAVINMILLSISIYYALWYVYTARKKKFIIFWMICYCLLFLCYRISRGREILDLFVYSSLFSCYEKEKINNRYLMTISISIFVIVILSVLKIMPTSPIIYRDGNARYSLGFTHPNTFGFLLFLIAASLFIKFYSRKNGLVFLVITLLDFICLFINKSRMCAILIMVLDVVYLLKVLRIDRLNYILSRKIIRKTIEILIIICLLLSIYLLKNYSNPVIAYIDEWCHGRIVNALAFVQKYPIKLYGNRDVPDFTTNIEGWGAVYLDNGFLYCLIRKGIINTVFYIFIMVENLRNAMRKKEYADVIVLLLLIVSLFFESSGLVWFYAFPLLFYFNINHVLESIVKGVMNHKWIRRLEY